MTLAIAIIGAVTGILALVWSIYQGRVSLAASQREEERREKEIALARSEFELRLKNERTDQAAVLVAKSTGYSGSDRGVDFPVSVRNVGLAPAQDVTVWLARDEPELPAVSPPHELGPVAQHDNPAKILLTQPAPFLGGKVPRPGRIVASWNDGNGEHTEPIGKLEIFV